MSGHWMELVIFALLFALITGLGFYAARWKPGAPLNNLNEWGLAGRRFGSWIIWFLIGGDLYTAYTFVAVPALMFGAGAMGFFALPYTIIVYPLVFLPLVRLWSVSQARGYVTAADFVLGRYGSPTLALLVAVTGILATMPYIALQLAGLEAVLRTMGLNGAGLAGHTPLFVAFMISALYTYKSGLRAPTLIAFVKALLIYPVIIAAVIILPARLGGWGTIFDAADAKRSNGILLGTNDQLHYVTLMLGSALALFLYPHALTAALASRSRDVIKRNMTALPAYSLALGLFALLGYAAIAAGTSPIINAATGQPDSNTLIPMLFENQFPSWFSGIAFAAIGIGALVPAAIMSIGAANLWTRNIYKPYLQRETNTLLDLDGLCAGHRKLGQVTRELGELNTADTHDRDAEKIAERLNGQGHTPKNPPDVVTCRPSDLTTARTRCQELLDIAQHRADEAPTPKNLRELALTFEQLGDIDRQFSNLTTARTSYKRALKTRLRLADKLAGQEAKQGKIASLVVKLGAVAMIVLIDPQYSISLQLIGSVIILQTLPTVAIALYTRWFHRWGLVAGWTVGLVWGLSMLYNIPNPISGRQHFGGTSLELGGLSILNWEPFAGSTVQIYPGFVALVGNLVMAAVVTIVLRQVKMRDDTDETEPKDYHSDVDAPQLKTDED